MIYAKIDRKKKILGTIFLRALGFSTREEIIDQFYETETVAVDAAKKEELVDKVLARAVKIKNEDGEEKVLLRAGSTLHMHEVDDLISQDVKEITIILFDARKKKGNKDEHNPSLDSRMIINCFEREDMKYTKEGASDEEPTLEDALTAVFSILKPGEPMAAEAAKNELEEYLRYCCQKVALSFHR